NCRIQQCLDGPDQHSPYLWSLYLRYTLAPACTALSIPVMILNWYAAKKGAGNTLIVYTFGLANLIMTIVLIGIFEGMYNHVAKNVLYFSELNDSTMTRLFPPPTYVMPNDFF